MTATLPPPMRAFEGGVNHGASTATPTGRDSLSYIEQAGTFNQARVEFLREVHER
jgi:hypothetical protein